MPVTTLHVRPAWIVGMGEAGLNMQFLRGNGPQAAELIDEICLKTNKGGWGARKINEHNAVIDAQAVTRDAVVVTTTRQHAPHVKMCIACAGMDVCAVVARQGAFLKRQGIAIKLIDGRGMEQWFGAATMGRGAGRGDWQDDRDGYREQQGAPRHNPGVHGPYGGPGFQPPVGVPGMSGMPGMGGMGNGMNWQSAARVAGAAAAMGGAAFVMQALSDTLQQFFVPPPPPPPPPPPAIPLSVTHAMNTLGITGMGSLTEENVRAAHRRHILTTHPDKSGNNDAGARINGARDLLLEYLKTGKAPT